MRRLQPYARCKTRPEQVASLGDRGFTLLEVIASLVLLGLLAAVFGMGLVAALQSHEFSRSNVRLAQKAQPATMRIARELTELTHIEDWSSTSILYQRMPLGTAAAVQRMGLVFDGANNVLRLVTNFTGDPPLSADQGEVLVDGVNQFNLNYLSDLQPWGGIDMRRLSTIEIQLELLHPGESGATRQFHTRVHLRNTRNFGGATPTTQPASSGSYSCFVKAISQRR